MLGGCLTGTVLGLAKAASRGCTGQLPVLKSSPLSALKRVSVRAAGNFGKAATLWAPPCHRPGGRPAHGGEVRRVVGARDQRRAHVLAPHAHRPVARAREALGEEGAARDAVHRRVVPCAPRAEQLLSRRRTGRALLERVLGWRKGSPRHASSCRGVPCASSVSSVI